MPKVILELEMPESCKKCQLKYYLDYSERNYPWEDYVCTITGKGIADKGRRLDCPLKPVEKGGDEMNKMDDKFQVDYLPNAKKIIINLPEEVWSNINTIIMTRLFQEELVLEKQKEGEVEEE